MQFCSYYSKVMKWIMTLHVQVPSAGSVGQLAVPHFGLGLGIGVVDAALVPLLASLMDSRYAAHYGSVYALQQMAVSLAYSLGRIFLIFRCQLFYIRPTFLIFFLDTTGHHSGSNCVSKWTLSAT
jgi:MFS family permease